jgi:4'-phosphopantetheinyl transferase
MPKSYWDRVTLRQLPRRLRVLPGKLHLWSIAPHLPEWRISELAPLLSENELNRAAQFVLALDQRRYIVTHAALRTLLARYTGASSCNIQFFIGPQGKPALPTGDMISFNLSHSGELTVIAISSPAQLGVDIERLRPIRDAREIARFYFTPGEEAALAAVPQEHMNKAFMTVWTRKEAFVKALGGGLSIDLQRFEVSIATEHPALLRARDSTVSTSSWSLVHLEPAHGYVGAVATDGPVRDINFRHLDPSGLERS